MQVAIVQTASEVLGYRCEVCVAIGTARFVGSGVLVQNACQVLQRAQFTWCAIVVLVRESCKNFLNQWMDAYIAWRSPARIFLC